MVGNILKLLHMDIFISPPKTTKHSPFWRVYARLYLANIYQTPYIHIYACIHTYKHVYVYVNLSTDSWYDIFIQGCSWYPVSRYNSCWVFGPIGEEQRQVSRVTIIISKGRLACQVSRVIVTISRYFHLLEIMTLVSTSCCYKARLRSSNRDSVIHEIEQQSKLSETSG